jgi:hypothetical protein
VTAVPRQIKRRAAKRPEPRTVHVVIEDGDFAGWEATARADFPAKWLADFESGRIEDVLAFFERIIVDHNMPDEDGNIAERFADVDPYSGLLAISAALGDAVRTLPNR